jgi:hypothetical protein
MTVPFTIRDGLGSGRHARVTEDSAVLVSTHDVALVELDDSVATRRKVFTEFLRTTAGSKDATVNGSSTPVTFRQTAYQDRALAIYEARFLLNDDQMLLTGSEARRFGGAAASPGLTNGVIFRVSQGGVVTNIFNDPVKNIGDFLDYADDYDNIGNGVASGIDILNVNFKFSTPIILPATSTDYIEMVVQDNLTSVTAFAVRVRGYQELL